MGAEAGAELGDEGTVFDDEEVWYIADAIPEGMTAAIAVLEHRWAIPLRNAIADAGGVRAHGQVAAPRGPARRGRRDRDGARRLTAQLTACGAP